MSDAAFHVLAMRHVRYALSITASPFSNMIVVLGAVLVLNYMLAFIRYHFARKDRHGTQLPPKYPTLVPYLGHAIFSAWDLERFLYIATYVSSWTRDTAEQLRLSARSIADMNIQALSGEVHLDTHFPFRVKYVHHARP